MPVKKFAIVLFSALMLVVGIAFVSAQSNGCRLTIRTTKSNGTVWGTVQVSYNGQTVDVSHARQTLSLPCGTRVTLSEKPTNPSNWQFSSWASPELTFSHPSSNTVNFTLNVAATVSARYSAQSASSTSSGSSASWG